MQKTSQSTGNPNTWVHGNNKAELRPSETHAPNLSQWWKVLLERSLVVCVSVWKGSVLQKTFPYSANLFQTKLKSRAAWAQGAPGRNWPGIQTCHDTLWKSFLSFQQDHTNKYSAELYQLKRLIHRLRNLTKLFLLRSTGEKKNATKQFDTGGLLPLSISSSVKLSCWFEYFPTLNE